MFNLLFLELLHKMNKSEFVDSGWYIWVNDYTSDYLCDECKALDGRIFRGKDIPRHPLHFSCRCSVYEADPEFVLKAILEGRTIEKNGELRFVPLTDD